MKQCVDTICVGLSHFSDKIGYQKDVYSRNGKTIKYIVNDITGNSRMFIDKYKADVLIVPRRIIARIKVFISTLYNVRSKNVELYCGKSVMGLYYAVVAKLFGRNLIIILRGLEFSSSKWRLFLTRQALKLADLIIVKEYNLMEQVKFFNLQNKSVFIHNAVPPARSEDLLAYDERDIDVLFINTPRRSRHLLFLLEVFKRLLNEVPTLKITLAGFNILNGSFLIEAEYQHKVIERIKELGLEDKITILGYVPYGRELMRRAKTFVFPADIVFCNYALLESMSLGCVPIVSDGEAAEKIITNNVNGMISPMYEGGGIELFKKLVSQCLDKETWSRLSQNATDTITKDFSIDEWYRKIKEAEDSM